MAFTGDAPDKVVSAMEDNPNHLGVVGAGTRALLSLAGCLACKCYHDRPTQNTLGENGAVEALVSAASFFLSHPLVEAARDLPPEDRGCVRRGARENLWRIVFSCAYDQMYMLILFVGFSSRASLFDHMNVDHVVYGFSSISMTRNWTPIKFFGSQILLEMPISSNSQPLPPTHSAALGPFASSCATPSTPSTSSA